jgi:hypothetical protein
MAPKTKNCSPSSGGKSTKKVFDAQNAKKSWWGQGFLMVHADSMIEPLREGRDQSEFIKQIRLKNTHDDTGDLINRLTTNNSILSFFDGRPIDYSQLVPHIELRKVYVKSKKHVEEVVFPFATHEDFSPWKQAQKGESLFRGRSAGI